ncbi:MAG: LPS export ABC transporter ATP-binding protein [Candidatus Eremiobacteraeota bacterium]|nr:LPS export ABC transporter ATP-binding protein [Candidatus Eremiobacteraeota bacterium]
MEGLVKSYRGRRVVDGVSIYIEKGEIVGLLGPNGAGKTTTFYMSVGLVMPEKGSILLNGRDITRYPMHVRALMGMGYLAQENSVFRRLTVEENIRVIWEMRDVPRKAQNERLPRLMEEFGLQNLIRQPAYSLSGGERRRVEIARALATDPDFILLDEPFTGVDPIAVSDIQEIIMNLKGKGIGILITDHSVRETLAITERSYIIRDGRILVSGDSKEVAESPIARKYYLGERFRFDAWSTVDHENS